MTQAKVPDLRGDFFHGTARSDLAFAGGRVAYFTRSESDARDHAEMDSEVENGVPHVIRVRLRCLNPAVVDTRLMQDLHHMGARVRELATRGFDCAVGDSDQGEVAVFGSYLVEVLEVTKLRDARLSVGTPSL